MLFNLSVFSFMVSDICVLYKNSFSKVEVMIFFCVLLDTLLVYVLCLDFILVCQGCYNKVSQTVQIKQEKFILSYHSSGGQKSIVKVWAGLNPSEGQERSTCSSPLLLVVQMVILPHVFTSLSLYLCLLLCPNFPIL